MTRKCVVCGRESTRLWRSFSGKWFCQNADACGRRKRKGKE